MNGIIRSSVDYGGERGNEVYSDCEAGGGVGAMHVEDDDDVV